MDNKYEANIGHWIKRYHLLAAREMEAVLKPYGIGRTQWYILFHIIEVGELPQRQIQATLHIESATLTNLVSTLVQKGWVIQLQDPKDKRGKLLQLTEDGKRLWHILPNPIERVKARALRGIPQNDITQAIAVIKDAVKNLEQEEK